MINTQQVTRLASDNKVDAKTVERDYVIHHILASLPESEGLIFKGGTSLRACHFSEYRYSADLDFSLVGISRSDALTIVAESLGRCRERTGMAVDVSGSDAEGKPKIVFSALGSQRTIKLDLADDELVEDTEVQPLIRRYDDLPEAAILTYTLAETSAEKLRCVIQRTQCRDLFDMHRLFFVEGIDPLETWPVFERKARHRSKDPDRFGERFDAVLRLCPIAMGERNDRIRRRG